MANPETSDTPSALRRAITLSPERKVQVQVGALWTAGVSIVGCVVTSTVFIVNLKTGVDGAVAGIDKIDKRLEKLGPEHTILWEAYQRGAPYRGRP